MDSPLATSPLALAYHYEDGPGVYVEMLRTGIHKSRFVGGHSASGHEEATFTKADLESAVRGFEALKSEGYLVDGRAPVGYEHNELASALRMAHGQEPDPGEVMAAAAWYSHLRVVPNEDGGHSLEGLHHFTEDGRRRVRSGAFRSYSIDIAPPGRMQRRDGTVIQEWVPFGGTVTNSPFVRGMSPLAASENTPQITPEPSEMNIDHLRGPLALSEDATDTDAIAALHELKKAADERDSWKEAAERALSERDDAKAALASMGERQKTLAIKQAVHEERIALSEGEDYWTAVTTLGEEWAHRHFNEGRVAQRSRVPAADTDPAERGEEVAETADDKFERLFSEYVRAGKTEREAYNLASADTFDARNAAYANA
tara:strand:+ start:308 stop:1423 length:1116 start_codon:yes stop_codon:yes gene_type:complete